MKETTLPLAEIKAHLSEIVDRIEAHHERILLTRNGRPAAILMAPEDLATLEDALELLSDPAARRDIRRAQRQIAAGEGISAERLRERYLNGA
jgi:prevent-host-death family protein